MRDTSSLWRPVNVVVMLAIVLGMLAQTFELGGFAQLAVMWVLVAILMQVPAI